MPSSELIREIAQAVNLLACENKRRIMNGRILFREGVRVESGTKPRGCTLTFLIFCLLLPAFGQQDEPQIPTNFKLDFETAARLRPQLMEQSTEVSSGSPGRVVLERLIRQVPDFSSQNFSWDLRIAETNDLNAYSSPDGTIYVDNRLAQLAGRSAGLWAAILSHEIAHVLRRDWARRYLYQKILERDRSIPLLLGEPGSPSGAWSSSQKASQSMAQFCRRLEIGADRDGLMLMARAGLSSRFRSCPAPLAARPRLGNRQYLALCDAPVLGRARSGVDARLRGR